MYKNFFRNDAKPPTVSVAFDDVRVGDWIYHENRIASTAERVYVKHPNGIVTGSTSRDGFLREYFRGGVVAIVDRDYAAANESKWTTEYHGNGN